MKVGDRFMFLIVLVFAVTGMLMIWGVNDQMRGQALAEAKTKATLLLERNLATHAYFSHRLKPSVFQVIQDRVPSEYFDPAWMSSTYAVRSIDGYFKNLSSSDYYYKECAINARDPLNEADGYERLFIDRINADPELKIQTDLRELNGRTYYVVLYRGEVMEQSCLRCHSEPQAAPGDMVRQYGPERSFHRQVGEVVSAVSIRVPLDGALAETSKLTRNLAGGLVAGLLFLMAAIYWANRVFFTRPLEAFRQKTAGLAKAQGAQPLGPDFSFTAEWADLDRDFDEMADQIQAGRERLEERVRERTSELQEANRHLASEIQERKTTEQKLAETIRELQVVLAEVKTLKGLIPICSSCKKIRDDEGFWRQLEEYFQAHSEAQFSHGICPDCMKKLYPELVESMDRKKKKQE